MITCDAASGEVGVETTSSAGGEELVSIEDDIRGSEGLDDPERLNDVSGEGR